MPLKMPEEWFPGDKDPRASKSASAPSGCSCAASNASSRTRNALSSPYSRSSHDARSPAGLSAPGQRVLLRDSGSWIQSQFCKYLADGIEIPDGDVAVVAGDGQPPAVGTPCQPIDRADLIGQRVERPAGLEVPEVHTPL